MKLPKKTLVQILPNQTVRITDQRSFDAEIPSRVREEVPKNVVGAVLPWDLYDGSSKIERVGDGLSVAQENGVSQGLLDVDTAVFGSPVFCNVFEARNNLHTYPFAPETVFPWPNGVFSVDSAELSAALKKCIRGADVALSVEHGTGRVSLVCTDNAQLRVFHLTKAQYEGDPYAETVLFDIKALALALDIAKPHTIRVFHALEGRARALFLGRDVRLSLNIDEKTFPNWRAIMPETQSAWVTFAATKDAQKVFCSIAKAVPVAEDSKQRVRLTTSTENSDMFVESKCLSVPTVRATVKLAAKPLAEFSVVLNVAYIADTLRAFGDSPVLFGFSSLKYPVTITDQNGTDCLIMPIGEN